jgi:hypothetical protein
VMARLDRFLLIAVVFCLASCRQCDQFSQIRLVPGDGIQVLETGVPALPGLERAEPAPLSYILHRENYEVVFHATPNSYGPSETIVIRSLDGKRAGFVALPTEEQACVSYITQPDNAIRMSWWGGAGCALHQEIKFRVLSASGKVIADERVAFDISRNGSYCVADGP